MFTNLSKLFAFVGLLTASQQLAAQSPSIWIADSLDCQTGISTLHTWILSGNAPYVFQWSDGNTTQAITNPVAGQLYSVTVTDATGATVTGNTTAQFSSFTPVSVMYNVIQNACDPNGLGGIVDVTVTGGTPPYSFQWSNNGFTTEDVTGLLGNDYLTVDHSGNYCNTGVNIQVGGGMFFFRTIVTEANCTMSNGSIALYAQGNYNFEWSNGQTSNVATGLAAGAYGVTVTDPVNNCTVRRVFQVDNTINCASIISGNVYHNANCQPIQNGYHWYQQVVITDNTTGQVYYPYTDANGYYEFRTTDATSYSISVTPYNGMSVICPNSNNAFVSTTAQGGVFANNDFFIARANNVDVQISHWSPGVRPFLGGFDHIWLCNAGNLTQSGDITLTLDPLLSYVSNSAFGSWSSGTHVSTPVTPVVSGNVLTFPYSNLQSGECRNLSVEIILNSNQPFGTTLSNTVSVTPLVGDAVPADNSDIAIATVVNSYDPNDKQQFNFRLGNSLNAEIYTQDTEMDYLIRFQNTGNAPAIRVEVRDTFENALIASSVRNINSSHPADVRVEGNVLIATFNNIYLADSFSNEPASHGFISFKMNRQANLPINTAINNSGAIYFDFNEPVITNSQITTIVQEVAVAQTRAEEIGLQIMPNPAADVLNVQYQLANNSEVSLNVVNGMGQVIKTISQSQNQTAGAQNIQIAVQDLPSGVYYVLIKTEKGNYAKKFVKQ